MSERLWEQNPEPGVYSPREVTSHIKQLFRVTDELKQDVKAFRDEQVRQGNVLTEIKSATTQIAASVAALPAWGVELLVRQEAMEKTMAEVETRLNVHDKKPCANGCQNDDDLARCMKFVDTWGPRLWMAVGGLYVILGVWALVKFLFR